MILENNKSIWISLVTGAVGSLVGQLAKLAGCHVIGFAGSDEKCQYLINELSFDNAYNYKKVKVEDAMKDGAPNGVDCFFDNVGGPDSSVIINHMNQFGQFEIWVSAWAFPLSFPNYTTWIILRFCKSQLLIFKIGWH